MKKNNKKGFTLVELLVVIAILAILATVTVVGYLGFTQRAKESNATFELTQVRNVINAYTLEGPYVVKAEENNTQYTITLDDNTISITSSKIENDGEAAIPVEDANVSLIIALIPDLESLSGTFAINASGDLEYTYEEGIVAVWDISENTVFIK